MKDTILIDYLKGLLNPEEQREVIEWYDSSAENKKRLDDLYYIMFVSDRIDAVTNVDVKESFEDFKTKAGLQARNKKLNPWRKIASIAAIFIGLIFLGSSLSLWLLDSSSQNLVVATQLGERAQVCLPDGSKVWLNACSKVEYSKSFFSNKRKVMLTGEGYFDVKRNKITPFIVYNNTSKVKVLGTRFNVKCNDDDPYITTSLLEGSILFSDNISDLEVVLKPGEEIIHDRISNTYTIRNINSDNDAIAWMDGKIIFNNSSFKEIAKELERHYNVKITFADDKISAERFNADFETPDNIYQILSILERTGKFNYSLNKNNREITISSRD